jgi:hypothetical protein
MKKLLLFIMMYGLFMVSYSQENNTNTKVDRSTLTIRPNSREYSPVRKTNLHKRMENRQANSMIKRGIQNQNRINKDNRINRPNNPAMRRSPNMRRSQQEMIKRQQQRMLRRKMIQQQQRRIRRR